MPAGVEACASTGGVLMPPVMGATAFVMATFLEIGYAEIVVAAAFPSLLYYLGLFMQIDSLLGALRPQGAAGKELPPVGQVLRDGWYFVFVFVMLIVMLLYLRREAQAPYYATVVLLVINQLAKTHRWSLTRFVEFVDGVGKLFAELAAVLAGVGLIIGALTLTGKVGSLTYELVRIAGRLGDHAAHHGRADQLHSRHRHDGHGGLSFPRGDDRACAGARRASTSSPCTCS